MTAGAQSSQEQHEGELHVRRAPQVTSLDTLDKHVVPMQQPNLNGMPNKDSSSAAAAQAAAAAAATAAATLATSAVDSDSDFPNLTYMSGFGNHMESEALPGALPVGRNNPRVCPYGLYAEQLSGTAFTAPRKDNQRSWLYRIKPSVTHEPFVPNAKLNPNLVANFSDRSIVISTPNQLRWRPVPVSVSGHTQDFVEGLFTVCGTGSPDHKLGYAVHMYTANKDMHDRAFANADGDMLIVPQQGRLWVTTEFGRLEVRPQEILVVQQGIRFAVNLPDGPSRGYVCEVFGNHFQLPELGPIGANGLANPRDFQTPVAWFDDALRPGFTVVHKYDGQLFQAQQDFSPFNVVAWHGNYVPFKYDLARFCPMNAVAFDHPDPSIFTVLTCPSSRPGVATVDFVIFPPRWTVAEATFRPPYFHRNCMSEFMGLIRGVYEAKAEGFLPGGASLHSCMTPHGPDTDTFERAVSEEANTHPEKLQGDTLAFMFESCFTPRVTTFALQSPQLDPDYYRCWQGLRSHFTASTPSTLTREPQP